MVVYIKLILFLNNFLLIYCNSFASIINPNYIQTRDYVFWPNATVPFFINPEHFDHEQSLTIMTTLSMFAFKTCLKFAPVMALPHDNQHVLTFVNPDGIRRCVIDVEGNSVFSPHYLIVGYDCLKSPHLEMTIMKTLGFPFEHNRHSRDVFIEVLFENIEPRAIELFTKDMKLPQDLQILPYDYNSVMHFDDRQYSKNGHRTFIFRDHRVFQNRKTLSLLDLRKIEIVYGPECLKRDRQEKIDLCQEYPGVARRKRGIEDDVNIIQERAETNIESGINDQNSLRKKRDIKDVSKEIGDRKRRDIFDDDVADEEHEIDNKVRVKRNIDDSHQEIIIVRKKRNVELEPVTINLRVNRNITPPPDQKKNLTETLKLLGIENEVMEIIEKVYKVSSLALKNARAKYCNNSKPDLRTGPDPESTVNNSSDILDIIESVSSYAASMVDNAVNNLTVFCENSGSIDEYQRARCPFYDLQGRCRESYRSTKSGRVRYSTQHRPTYFQHTKHDSRGIVYQHHYILRTGNNTEQPDITTELNLVTESLAPEKSRKKRDVGTIKNEENVTKVENVTEVKKEKRDDEGKSTSIGKGELKATEAIDLNGRSKRDVENKNNLNIDVKKDELNVGNNTTNVSAMDQVNLDANKTSEGIKDVVNDVKELNTSVSKDKGFRDSRRVLLQQRKLKRRNDEDKSEEVHSSDSSDSAEKHKKRLMKKERKRESMPRKEREVKRDSDEEEEIHSQKKPRNIPKSLTLSKSNFEFYKERRWLDGVVRYIIKEDSAYDIDDLRDRISEVNNILHKKTCVRLQEITEGSANKYDDYLVLDTSPDYVTGRVGGRQHFGSLELFHGHQHRQHTAMMVMAMLGFYFELSRHDRDKHVRVHMRHVRPDKLHHFEKIRAEATFSLPYDFESATHPAWQFWRKVGRTGISTVATYKDQDPDSSVMKSLGQHDKLLSDLDIVKINSVYGVKCFKKLEKKEKRHRDTD